jgi:dipeptidyl aminopeptidase/acylaminoacyl peptidase
MRQKSLLLIGLLFVLFTASGCLDLFSVPGLAISPDGSTVYFLSGPPAMINSGFSSSLTALNVSDGSTEVIAEGSEDTLISAFAVSPTDGSLAYVKSAEDGAFTIEWYSGGSTSTLSELPVNTIGTMAAFSPDGSWLALTAVTLPEDVELGGEDLSEDAVAAATFNLYLVNVADGSLTTINDTETTRANTIAWSPDGSYLAYNAWMDTNEDGRIQTSGGLDFSGMMGGASTEAPEPDLSQVFIYNVGDGSTTQVESETADFGQVFLDDSSIAYISLNFTGMMTGELPSINVYDIDSGESENVYSTQGFITGVSVSPDGSQVAWTEVTSNMGGGDEPAPGTLNIAGTDFEVTQSVTLEGIAMPDAPVWVDDESILAAGTNILGSFMGTFSASFSASISSDGTTSSQVETPEIPLQQILLVGTDGSIEVLYEGTLLNPSFVTSLLALADMGDMAGMTGQ